MVACVICKFVIQQTDKSIDISKDCPELSELEMYTSRQKSIQKDPEFKQKWKIMSQLKTKQLKELNKTYTHEDDMYYYIINPNHLKQYIDVVDEKDDPDKPNDPNDPKKPDNPNNDDDDGQDKVNEKKTVIYHELDDKNRTKQPFKSEILIKHQYQMKQADPEDIDKQNKQKLSQQWIKNAENIQNLIKQTSFLQTKWIDFNSAGNKINPEWERPIKRGRFETVNTDADIFDLMNDDKQYLGYGKGLFPPHPDDLQPENKCCTSYPCINKNPCKDSDIKKLRIAGLDNGTPQEVVKVVDLWMRFRQNDKKIFDSQNRQQFSIKSSSFLQLDQPKQNISNYFENENYNKNTLRLQKRNGTEDQAWDCLHKNLKSIIKFICEQEVALSYTKYCEQLYPQLDILTESWLYQDTSQEICQNVGMCKF